MERAAWRGFNWTTGPFVIGYHVALLIGLPIYFMHNTPGLPLILISIVMLFATEIGIGAAYHRFYSHRAYKMSRPAEAVLLFLATLATQGDALRWSFEHRLHHSYTDTDDDPYSFARGFWYAHILWMFERSRPMNERWVKDLRANPLVAFQHKYIAVLMFGSNAIVTVLIGWAISDFLGAFVLAWWTRMAVSHHLTWFVNSLCHCWGERTFSKELSAVDNYALAVMTVGEGYHNFHHTFPSDYRNGIRWYHVDPTKWTIWTLSKLGLASGLKRVDEARIERRLLREDRRLLVSHLEQAQRPDAPALKERIDKKVHEIQEALGRRLQLSNQIRQLRKERNRVAARERRRELKSVTQALRREWRDWNRLCGNVLAS